MKTSINNSINPANAGQTTLDDSSRSCGFISTKLLVIATLIMLVLAQARLFAQPPTILAQPSSRVVWAGATVRFGASTGSIPPTSYFWLFDSTNLPSGMFISTVAGTGASGYSGDGGPATNASLNYPQGVMVDAAGNLFIANTSDNRIRKVGADGNITTVAGNGTEGYSGDGGTATNASLNLPSNVAMDASGNLFIADTFNCVIRKVDTNGTITTVAGNGPTLRAFPGFSGDGSPATNASLYETSGVAVDASGNLYLSDTVGNEAGFGFVRKVDTNGFITTIAGNGIHGYSGDGGAATNASMTWPYGVAVDASGNLFIADFYYPCVRKVGTNGIITTVTGKGTRGFSGDGGAATNASLWAPSGIAVDNSGNLFIADTGNGRIRKVNTNGIITTVAGGAMNDHGDGVVATNTTLNTPYDVAVDAADNLFIADTYNQRVRLVNSPQWPNTQLPGLWLTNVTAANAGNYQEVVTDPNGSVTSDVARLTVVTSPLIYQTVHNSNSSVALNFVSRPASTNVVLCATNLLPPVVWQPISTNVAGANGDWQFTDTNTAGFPTRFYRSLMQ